MAGIKRLRYSTLTPEQIQRKVEKARAEMKREMERKKRQEDKDAEKLAKERATYPPTVLTLAKRIKRMDPWNTVVQMDPTDACVVVYYKLKQRGIHTENLRIAVNVKHCWVEFKFADRWYIIDVKSILQPDLGQPLKEKTTANHSFYTNLTRYYDIDDFFKSYGHRIEYTKDEAKIIAMEDEGLNSAIKVIYH